ncbi:MAG: tRNA-dihydrouridine synthase family protein [Nanoarchaeota archaeon]
MTINAPSAMGLLYFAPLNIYGNHAFRHLLLRHFADMVFTELILERDITFSSSPDKHDKLSIVAGDESRTIVQIAASEKESIEYMIDIINKRHPRVPEINLNMGCPQSSLVKRKLGCGLLLDEKALSMSASALVWSCRKRGLLPSVKLRLGPEKKIVRIDRYIDILKRSGIQKIYIHARTRGQSYHEPANYSSLKDIGSRQKDISIVINGDIDGPDMACYLSRLTGIDDLMVGRAAMLDPFVFERIRVGDASISSSRSFNPLKKDPYRKILPDGSVGACAHKKEIILDFISISIRNDLPLDLAKRNLMMMLKGITGIKPVLSEINAASSFDGIIASLNRHPFI